jgi:hypothetical protein
VNNREKNYAYYEGNPGKLDTKEDEKEWARIWHVKVSLKLKIFL